MNALSLPKQLGYNDTTKAYTPMLFTVKNLKTKNWDMNYSELNYSLKKPYYNPSSILIKSNNLDKRVFTCTPIIQQPKNYSFRYNPLYGYFQHPIVQENKTIFYNFPENKRIVKVLLGFGNFLKTKLGSMLSQYYKTLIS